MIRIKNIDVLVVDIVGNVDHAIDYGEDEAHEPPGTHPGHPDAFGTGFLWHKNHWHGWRLIFGSGSVTIISRLDNYGTYSNYLFTIDAI